MCWNRSLSGLLGGLCWKILARDRLRNCRSFIVGVCWLELCFRGLNYWSKHSAIPQLSYDLSNTPSKTLESPYSNYTSSKSSSTNPSGKTSLSKSLKYHLLCTSHTNHSNSRYPSRSNYISSSIHLFPSHSSSHMTLIPLRRYPIHLRPCWLCLSICWRFYQHCRRDLWYHYHCWVIRWILPSFILFLFVRRLRFLSFGTLIVLFQHIRIRFLIVCSFSWCLLHSRGVAWWFRRWLWWFWTSCAWWSHVRLCFRYLEPASWDLRRATTAILRFILYFCGYQQWAKFDWLLLYWPDE